MRFRHPDGSLVHLAYCTNVHPAEDLDGVMAQLRDHAEPVRRLPAATGWASASGSRAMPSAPSAPTPPRCAG